MWSDADGDHMTIGLKACARPAFPEAIELAEDRPARLIDAELLKEPTDKTSSKRSKRSPKGRELVSATDFDRAGE